MKTRNKLILIGFVTVAILLFAGMFVYFETIRGVGKLKITVLPTDTNYSVGGKKYGGNQELSLKSGVYNISFNRPFFKPTTKSITITKNQTTSLEISLLVDETKVKNLSNMTASDQTIIDTSEQILANEERVKFRAENPIVEILPVITDKYRIDYGIYSQNTPTIEITLFTEALAQNSEETLKSAALKSISQYNIDPTKIVWYKDSKTNFSQ